MGHHIVTWSWVNIGAWNCLLPNGTKSLPESLLTRYSWRKARWSKLTFKINCQRSLPGDNELIYDIWSNYTAWCHLQMATWWRHQMQTFSSLLAFLRVIHRPPVDSPRKASDAELFLSAPEQIVEQTIETLVIWDAIALLWHHWNEICQILTPYFIFDAVKCLPPKNLTLSLRWCKQYPVILHHDVESIFYINHRRGRISPRSNYLMTSTASRWPDTDTYHRWLGIID